MIVELKVFSTLREHVAGSGFHLDNDRWELPGGTTARDLGGLLNIPEREIRIILINGRKAREDQVLKEGDTIHIFPPLMGG